MEKQLNEPMERPESKEEPHLFAEWRNVRWFCFPVGPVMELKLGQQMTISQTTGTVVGLAMSGERMGHVCIEIATTKEITE